MWGLFVVLWFVGSDPVGPKSLNELAWITGSWRDAKGQTEEHWTTPVGGMLVGMSRTVSSQDKTFFEFLRIEQRPDGLFYVVQPSGAPPVAFKLVEYSDGLLVFSNPDNAFPSEIRYERSGDTLSASISGQAPTIKWVFSRFSLNSK